MPRYSGSETLERRQEDSAQSHGRGWKRGKPVALCVEPWRDERVRERTSNLEVPPPASPFSTIGERWGRVRGTPPTRHPFLPRLLPAHLFCFSRSPGTPGPETLGAATGPLDTGKVRPRCPAHPSLTSPGAGTWLRPYNRAGLPRVLRFSTAAGLGPLGARSSASRRG